MNRKDYTKIISIYNEIISLIIVLLSIIISFGAIISIYIYDTNIEKINNKRIQEYNIDFISLDYIIELDSNNNIINSLGIKYNSYHNNLPNCDYLRRQQEIFRDFDKVGTWQIKLDENLYIAPVKYLGYCCQ